MLSKFPFKQLSGGFGEIACHPQPDSNVNPDTGELIDPEKNAVGYPRWSNITRVGKHGMHYHGMLVKTGLSSGTTWELQPENGAAPLPAVVVVGNAATGLMPIGDDWPPILLKADDAPDAPETPQAMLDKGQSYKNHIYYKPSTYYLNYLVYGDSTSPLVSYNEEVLAMNGKQWLYTPTFGVTYQMWLEWDHNNLFEMIYLKARRMGAVLDKHAGGRWYHPEDGAEGEYVMDYRDTPDVQTIAWFALRGTSADPNVTNWPYPIDIRDGNGSTVLIEYQKGQLERRTKYNFTTARWESSTSYNPPEFEEWKLLWDHETGLISVEITPVNFPVYEMLRNEDHGRKAGVWFYSNRSRFHVKNVPLDRPFYMNDKLCFFVADMEGSINQSRTASQGEGTYSGSYTYNDSLLYTLYLCEGSAMAVETKTLILTAEKSNVGTDTLNIQDIGDGYGITHITYGCNIHQRLSSTGYTYDQYSRNSTTDLPVNESVYNMTFPNGTSTIEDSTTISSIEHKQWVQGHSGIGDWWPDTVVEPVGVTQELNDHLNDANQDSHIAAFGNRVYPERLPTPSIHHIYQAQTLERHSQRTMIIYDPTKTVDLSYYPTGAYPISTYGRFQGRAYRLHWWHHKGFWLNPVPEEVGSYATYTYTLEWIQGEIFRFYPTATHLEEHPDYLSTTVPSYNPFTGEFKLEHYGSGSRWV